MFFFVHNFRCWDHLSLYSSFPEAIVRGSRSGWCRTPLSFRNGLFCHHHLFSPATYSYLAPSFDMLPNAMGLLRFDGLSTIPRSAGTTNPGTISEPPTHGTINQLSTINHRPNAPETRYRPGRRKVHARVSVTNPGHKHPEDMK